jgi:hypothetical protein
VQRSTPHRLEKLTERAPRQVTGCSRRSLEILNGWGYGGVGWSPVSAMKLSMSPVSYRMRWCRSAWPARPAWCRRRSPPPPAYVRAEPQVRPQAASALGRTRCPGSRARHSAPATPSRGQQRGAGDWVWLCIVAADPTRGGRVCRGHARGRAGRGGVPVRVLNPLSFPSKTAPTAAI